MIWTRVGHFALLVAFVPRQVPSSHRANFVLITVTTNRDALVRAVWRPTAGAVDSTGDIQQARAIASQYLPNRADSVRRWRDPSVWDTVTVKAPTHFVVDMTISPAVFIEVVAGDSVRVDAQLMPARGPMASAWGRTFTVTSDAITPSVKRGRP